MITLNFDEVLERTYNAKKGVEVRYGLGQGFEYCKQFADEAQGYATSAKASEKKATDAVAGIEQTKADAVQAVQNAQTTATTAVQQAQSTATTAVTTKQTEAVQAVDDEREAALQQVTNSTQAAETAASNAAASEQAAQASKEAAATSAGAAESSAAAASGSASAAATSESNAASSAENSEASAARSEAAAEKAESVVSTDKTLTVSGAPADAAAVGAALDEKANNDVIYDSNGNVIFYSKAAVDKLLAGKLDLMGGVMNGELIFLNSYYGSILGGADLASPQPGDTLANLVIKSWGGVSFTTDCPGQTHTGKTAVGIDCRGGIVSATRFRGPADNGVVVSGGGYIRFGDGTQICWEIGSYVDGYVSETNRRVNFPVAFASTPAIVATSNANIGNTTVLVGWESTTGFMIGETSGNLRGHTNWIAIGRWK